MTRQVCLLRGINVGGKNRVPMADLASFFRTIATNVVTYLNSGNVVFNSELAPEVVKEKTEAWLATALRVPVVVLVLPAVDLIEAANAVPTWWNQTPTDKNNVIFVMPPITPAMVAMAVGEQKPEYEKVAMVGQLVFWTAPLKTFSRTRWSKVVSTKHYGAITIRNANTFQHLVDLVTER